jgi:uncharacterized DUF497 family protein
VLIEFDPAKDAKNRAKHGGLSLADLSEFSDRMLVVSTYPGNDPERYLLIDQTALGFLTAVVTPRGDGERIRVISLRRARPKEVRMYEEASR